MANQIVKMQALNFFWVNFIKLELKCYNNIMSMYQKNYSMCS
jgi:hypothetical protein